MHKELGAGIRSEREGTGQRLAGSAWGCRSREREKGSLENSFSFKFFLNSVCEKLFVVCR